MGALPLLAGVTFVAAVPGCGDESPDTSVSDEDLAETSGAWELSGVKHVAVPPVEVPGPAAVDALRSKHEYWGAVELPFTDPGLHATGKLYVTVNAQRSTLRVMGEGIPVQVPPPGRGAPELWVYLDARRGATYPTEARGRYAGAEDRAVRFRLDALGQEPPRLYQARRLIPTFDPTTWVPTRCREGQIGCEFSADWREKEASPGMKRVDFELTIDIRAAGRVGPVSPEALGFAVRTYSWVDLGATIPQLVREAHGAWPEEYARDSAGDYTEPRRDLWATLDFHKPAGRALSLMTFNVKRFTDYMDCFETMGDYLSTGTPHFRDSGVDPAKIGRFLAPYDIVAVQEAWDDEELDALVSAANLERAQLGKPPFLKHGPPVHPDTQTVWSALGDARSSAEGLVQAAADEIGGECLVTVPPGTADTDPDHGGVYLLSSFPQADGGWRVFDGDAEDPGTKQPRPECRGEDCTKAKGVLWSRLWLGAPAPDCPGRCTGAQDEWLDVFTTHLNADATLCDWGSRLAAGGVYLQSMPNCGEEDDDIRANQLVTMNRYIDSKAAKDRPSIVMGDLNINGQGPFVVSPGTEYQGMMRRLGLSSVTTVLATTQDDDRVTPWPEPYGFDWDIDHADLLRERFPFDALATADTGTWIGTDAMVAGQRFDYILVRPPVDLGWSGAASPAVEQQRWMFARPAEREDVWQSPWPQKDGAMGPGENGRLSDHKPVVSRLELVPFREPPRYHPEWGHSWSLHVTSASGVDADCYECGELDLYPQLNNFECTTSACALVGKRNGAVCEGESQASAPLACMSDWWVARGHAGADVTFLGAVRLWDADSTSGDDQIPVTDAGGSAYMGIRWGTGNVVLRAYDWGSGLSYPVPGWVDFTATSADPIQFSTTSTRGSISLKMSLDEIPTH